MTIRLRVSAGLPVVAPDVSCIADAAAAVHQPRSIQAGVRVAVAVAELNYASEVATAWDTLQTHNCSVVMSVPIAGATLNHNSALPFVRPVPMQTVGALAVAEASVNLNHDGGFAVHMPVAHSFETITSQLGADRYTVRVNEYDLRQGELLTGVSGVFNLDTPEHIPNPIFKIASYKLTDLPAYPIYAGGLFSVHQASNKSKPANTRWGVGESLYHQPDLPYKVDLPAIPGGLVPEPNAREVHIIVNSVNVVSLPDNTPLAVADIKMNLDADSVSWKLSCEILNEASIALVKPDASGNKEIAITINGHSWVFFIATWGRSRSISGNQLDKRFSVSGYSRSQYLGLPYAPKRTRSIGTTTAVQAAADELLGTGFTLSWNTSDLPDWSMPNAVFSYQEQAPLQVIKRLAATAGAVVQPALDADVLTVRPRYWPVPWELAAATMDKTIHQSQILSEGGQLEYREKINAVFVSGESEGVAATITRQGTAGDAPGADVVESWLTSLEANTSRGRQEISASGDRVIHSLELAIPEGSAEPGLLLPGDSVAVVYDDAAQSYRGYVTAVSISVPGRGLAKVRQTVTVEQPIGWEE
jgi:hypothetical protein